MIIVAHHKCTTPVYFAHPINFSTSALTFCALHFSLFWTSMNVIRLFGSGVSLLGGESKQSNHVQNWLRAEAEATPPGSSSCTALMLWSLNKFDLKKTKKQNRNLTEIWRTFFLCIGIFYSSKRDCKICFCFVFFLTGRIKIVEMWKMCFKVMLPAWGKNEDSWWWNPCFLMSSSKARFPSC